MKRVPLAILALLASLAVSTPSGSAPSLPDIDEIRIHKAAHRLELVAGGKVVETYRVALGRGGPGPKRWEGDKLTPVGTYKIVGRFKGFWHQFITLSYPNDEDRKRYAELKKQGLVPAGAGVGNGIGIHGVDDKDLKGIHKANDWTYGCIALDDDEVDVVAARAKNGTRVVITE
jgi:murein L,D-transpeptidase YafK